MMLESDRNTLQGNGLPLLSPVASAGTRTRYHGILLAGPAPGYCCRRLQRVDEMMVHHHVFWSGSTDIFSPTVILSVSVVGLVSSPSMSARSC